MVMTPYTKRRLRLLSLLLALVMLFSMAACKGEPADTTQSITTDTTGTTDVPPAEDKTFVPTGEYTVVYSEVEGSSTALSQAMSYLSSAMTTVYGICPDRDDDYYRPSQGLIPNEYEILVGATNRPQSQAAFADLGVNDYTYFAESENVIVICGGSVSATVEAIEEFCREVLGYVDDVSSENKKTPIAIGDKVCHRASYPSSSVTLNGSPLSEWTMIIGATTASADIADMVSELICSYTGERISTVLSRHATGEEKNVIAIGLSGREFSHPSSIKGYHIHSQADEIGTVLSLVASKSHIKAMIDKLAEELSVSTKNGSTSITLDAVDHLYFSVEEEITEWNPASEHREELYDGVTYLEQVFYDDKGLPYRTYALILDPEKVNFITGTANGGYDCALETANRQTTQQHMQAAVAKGENIIAGINTNFFNIHSDYSPLGIVVKDGVEIAPASSSYDFFGITEDGEIIIDSGSRYHIYVNSGKKFVHAVSGSKIILDKGYITEQATIDNVHPRSLVGITEDGKIIIAAIDGRQTNHSNGATLARCALWMRSLGAVTALNLDGGGSTNLILRDPATNAYTTCNSPSDGTLRKIHTSLLVKLKENG